MKSILSRVHLHTHKEPNGRAYIVGDRQGLRALSKALEQAAITGVGLETVKLHSSDGHVYEIMIVADVSEEEWQTLPVPYDKSSNPKNLEKVKIYESIKTEIGL